ncbi:NAD(P)H-binding protein [uncultured Bartonella sp.]|uniref:NAD(P)H-binding protein n=1 Tax=uncultured Bartonella sp. TaxID=104108 RepID=UPI002625C08C|nr:NAD(P)H-binding protein [uncultured Bartonella sp.]
MFTCYWIGATTVKVLFRSPQKAHKQFEANNRLELVQGATADIKSFCRALEGWETLFHTAAFFRDNYKAGYYRDELEKINIKGTIALLGSTYTAGIRNFVHVSSIAVFDGAPGQLIDEICDRNIAGEFTREVQHS